MRRPITFLFVIAAVLPAVPGWTGEERLALLGARARMTMTPVALDPADPTRRGLGGLEFIEGWQLTSPDGAFGGYSAIAVDGRAVTLLSDGGNIVRFTLGPDGRARGLSFANLPAGPGAGWDKADRDSESLAVDPVSGEIWVGFENYNAIGRYAPGFARGDRMVLPRAMADWPSAGGPESLVRMPDGRFVSISESERPSRRFWGAKGGRGQAREGLIWAADPLVAPEPARFAYVTRGTDSVSDAAALPDGRLLVLERGFTPPYRFHNRVVLVPAGAVRPGATVKGRVIAALDAPLIHDNFEGIAVSREGRDMIVWLVSADNRTPFLQRTLLLRFKLMEQTPAARPAGSQGGPPSP